MPKKIPLTIGRYAAQPPPMFALVDTEDYEWLTRWKWRAHNKSGYKGVSWRKDRNKWLAHITHQGKIFHLGLFDDPKEAYAAYCEAANRFHGEFARFS